MSITRDFGRRLINIDVSRIRQTSYRGETFKFLCGTESADVHVTLSIFLSVSYKDQIRDRQVF